jgi:hypothetical protein
MLTSGNARQDVPERTLLSALNEAWSEDGAAALTPLWTRTAYS